MSFEVLIPPLKGSAGKDLISSHAGARDETSAASAPLGFGLILGGKGEGEVCLHGILWPGVFSGILHTGRDRCSVGGGECKIVAWG